MTEEMSFSPVDTGDMSSVPPDAPPGEWRAEAQVKKAKTRQDGYPMLIVEWRFVEAADPDNEGYVGAKVADFIVFYPSNHKASKMSKIRMKTLCAELGISPSDASSLAKGSWDSLEPFIGEIESGTHTVYTAVRVEKTGEQRAEIHYKRPTVRI